MSNPESFIDEVTDEVRRDRLYAGFRKYGWIGVLLVLGIVAGAGYNEWSKAQSANRAQAFGDAVLDGLDLGAPEDRRAAIAAAPADGAQLAIRQLLLASDPVESKAATLEALAVLAADATQPAVYRDLAVVRQMTIAGADLPLADRRAALEAISAPGRPYRTLALEQLAYLQIEEGKPDAAIVALSALMQDQEAPSGLRSRAAQMITALGGEVPAAAPAVSDVVQDG